MNKACHTINRISLQGRPGGAARRRMHRDSSDGAAHHRREISLRKQMVSFESLPVIVGLRAVLSQGAVKWGCSDGCHCAPLLLCWHD